MYIKIYFDDKPLFLCDQIEAGLQTYLHHDDAIFIDELNSHAVKSMIHEMQQPQIQVGIYFHEDFNELKKAFIKKFTLVNAAGGFVQNEKGEVLMMFRRGKWDLPKGKQDKKESPEDCAVRETEEETGLQNIELNSLLLTTYHTYHEGSRFILKETNWYKMKVTGKQELVPQAEEDISKLKWVPQADSKLYLDNSYASVQDVVFAGYSTSD